MTSPRLGIDTFWIISPTGSSRRVWLYMFLQIARMRISWIRFTYITTIVEVNPRVRPLSAHF